MVSAAGVPAAHGARGMRARRTRDPGYCGGAQVRLVVLDSVAFHFRADWGDMAARTRALAQLAQALMRLAEAHDAAARPGDAGSVSCQGAVHCPTVHLGVRV
jgi:hypothetical protein